MSFIDDMLNPQIKKQAMDAVGTDAKDTFERKIKAHDWIKGISDLDPVQVEAEYQAKLKEEAMVLGKTAALDDVIADGVTPEEVVNKDYKRDVVSLSDYALAEMLAEARGHEKQNTSEMFYELKEKAKAEVASSREKAEKALLDLIPDHTMLDWQKAFKAFTKDAVPAEAKEKDLFRTDVPEKAHDFEHPTEEKFKVPADQDKAIPGNGREADERTDATKEAGVLQEDITKGLGKEAFLKAFKLMKKADDISGIKPEDNTKQYSDMLYTFFEAHPDMAAEMLIERLLPEELSDMVQSLTEMEEGVNDDLIPAGETAPSLQGLSSLKTAGPECSATDMILSDPSGLACANCGAEKGADGSVKHQKKHADTNDLHNTNAMREAFKQTMEGAGEDVLLDLIMQYMPEDDMKNLLDQFSDEGQWSPEPEHFEHSGLPTAVSHVMNNLLKKANGCPICASTGKDLKNGQKEHISCEACGLTYATASIKLAETDSHKLKRLRLKIKELNPIKDKGDYTSLLSQIDELAKRGSIKSKASKKEVIQKIAELKKTAEVASSWEVRTDEQGNEVIARVDQPTNVKESEEVKPDELIK